MAESIMNMFSSIFGNVMNWFVSLIDSMGLRSFILAGFALLFSVTFLIVPLRGNGLSDSAVSGGKSDKVKNNSGEGD